MRSFTVKVEGKEYDIQLQDDFAQSIEKELQTMFPLHSSLTIKELLHAYFQKSYECYKLEKKVENLLKKLSKE